MGSWVSGPNNEEQVRKAANLNQPRTREGNCMLYGELPEVKTEGGESLRGVTVKVANPPKTAVLGLPTSQQMIDRLSAQKSIRRSLGRRKSQTDYIPNMKADLALFNAIRQDKGGIEFDEFEAANAISKLTYCEVTDCQRAGDDY